MRIGASMLTRLIFILVLILAAPAWAAPTHVQSNCVTGALFAGTSAYVYTYPGAPTAGNLVVFTVATENKTVSSIAGTATTYSINGAHTQENVGSLVYNSQWKGIFAGSDTTATITVSANDNVTAHVCFAEFAGASSDQSSSTANGAAFAAQTAHNSGSVTPPTADNVVIASYFRTNGDWTEDGAFTSVSTGTTAYYFGYLIQSSATAQEYNATSVDGEYSAMRIGAFAGTSGAPAACRPGSRMLLGVGC